MESVWGFMGLALAANVAAQKLFTGIKGIVTLKNIFKHVIHVRNVTILS